MAELIHSIQVVFSRAENGFLQQNEYYNIPEYQRGYKWTKDNVKTLLDDILKFQPNIVNGENDKFYCVQNITLCRHQDKDGQQFYNVVDGQQRLTTLLIILSYLEATDLVTDKLKYSIRDESHEFITEFIIKGKVWQYNDQKVLVQDIDKKYHRKDIFYLSEAAFAVKEWFEENKDKLKKDTILNHVKLIVNNLSDTNEEKIFSNLNGGKVNLDGADLVRGILMTRVAGEILGDDKNKERINEHRVRIGMELDGVSLWWAKDEVKRYFTLLLPDKLLKNRSFDTINYPVNILYMLYHEKHIKDSTDFSFKFFEYGVNGNDKSNDDHLEMYQGILNLHYEMQDWFENREIYHLLGYLFNYFKAKINFKNIYQKWTDAASKEAFIKELKREIFQQFFIVSGEKNGVDIIEAFKEFHNEVKNIKFDWYNDDNQRLFRTLVLMDVIQISKSKNLSFLPATFFKPNSEDKEHIRSQTPKSGKNESRLKEDWKSSIVDLPDSEKSEIEVMLNKITCNELSDVQLTEIRNVINRIGLNSIGNMALLNLSVNRGYGNSSYIAKRRDILSNYMDGKYIRPHTLNAFVKKDSASEELNKWELSDIKQHTIRISQEIEDYFIDVMTK